MCIFKHNNRHRTGYLTWFYVFLNNDETSSQKLSLRLWFVGKFQVTKMTVSLLNGGSLTKV